MKHLAIIGLIVMATTLTACGQDNEEAPKEETPSGQISEGTEQNATKIGTGKLEQSRFFEEFNGKIDHVHGVGYAGNGNVLFFATHDGLKVYENGQWYKTKEENNDYMGFSATEDGFYTSGHPGMDSNLPNPLGIKKSSDFGETLQPVALEGETDFHTMGVGYSNEVIFALNPERNSIMETNQYYRSEDGGQSWKMVKANGLEGEIMSVAVHPTNPNLLAAAGSEGIYLSQDKGETFQRIIGEMTGTAIFFSEDTLWYGTYDGTPKLVKHSLADGTEQKALLPKLEEDVVLFFAQNPQNENEMTFVTFNGTIYQSADGAKTWKLLVEEGVLQ
ncbi:hypothetical protein J7E71_12865 [Mesobacillus foraminis]|uniref:F510_1955 family glycosylhydrolase n=1 Tax=Mesobacillus foraminis TaxID=279826 RepID=UPI001BE9C2FC|nr:hypothetical protein [Mesobacillus foraminis]MBT2756841.1 hypothetical protein [Mesobacillus foraminis]